MTTFAFTPATREQAKARIGLQGPAGSGKTMTALLIAERLADGGQIGLVDTERGSALTYAPVPGRPDLGGIGFLHLPLDNYDPRNLIGAVRAATAARLPVLIVDSWSHFWNGKGGLLEIVETAGRKPGAGGSFGGWREGNPIEQDMLEALLNYPGHVICTMRTKGDYSIEGKKVTKLGVKAVQREGAEYELGLIIDMVEGTGTVTKTRYAPLEGLTIHHPGTALAETILEQLGQGVDPVQVLVDELMGESLTYPRALELHAQARGRGLLDAGVLHPVTGVPTTVAGLIAERGTAVKPTPPVAATPTAAGPAREALNQWADSMADQGDAGRPEAAPARQLRAVPTVEADPWQRPAPAQQTPPEAVARAVADVPAESLTPAGRDYLHEAHKAPDAATVRQIWQDAKNEGARPGYLAQIAEVGRMKRAAERQMPTDADLYAALGAPHDDVIAAAEHVMDEQTRAAQGAMADAVMSVQEQAEAAERELRAFAEQAGLPDIATDFEGAKGVPLTEATAAQIRGFLTELRGTAA
jgi:hypothetical protein